MTSMAAALTDGSPVLVISGEVPSTWEGRGAFQDASIASGTDDQALMRSVTRASLAMENAHLVSHHLNAVLRTMLAGNRGPVHLSVPSDVQAALLSHAYQPLDAGVYRPRVVDDDALDQWWRLVTNGSGPAGPDGRAGSCSRIVILAGAGVEKSGAGDELRRFAERFSVPVATTLRAKGVLPEDHPLSLGVFGYAGTRHATDAILSPEVELLFVLGSGLNQRDTLFWDAKMVASRRLCHVDIDPAAIGRTWPTEIPMVGDVGEVLRRLLESSPDRLAVLDAGRADREAFLGRVKAGGPRLYDAENCASKAVPLHPARVIGELRAALPRDTILVVDSGAHRAFAGHYWQAYGPCQYLSATAIGPMGWAIPAGIGAKLARPGAPVAVITGDGCMRMHGMEVATAARYGAAVIFVVINNGALGNVWLRARTMGALPSELTQLPTHDWAGFARALGLQAATVTRPDELRGAFETALAARGPYLLDVRCDKVFTTPVTPFDRAKKEWHDDV
jgi:acetolactate synthase I/II/III large subunit